MNVFCDNSYGTLLNWPIVSLLFLFIFFSMFFVLIHDYTMCFTGSPYCIFSHCKFSYYNYNSIWPYYIVIHYPSCGMHFSLSLTLFTAIDITHAIIAITVPATTMLTNVTFISLWIRLQGQALCDQLWYMLDISKAVIEFIWCLVSLWQLQ